jgi:hypothetical protein
MVCDLLDRWDFVVYQPPASSRDGIKTWRETIYQRVYRSGYYAEVNDVMRDDEKEVIDP